MKKSAQKVNLACSDGDLCNSATNRRFSQDCTTLQLSAQDCASGDQALSICRDLDDGDLIVSSIYIWFRPDFGGSDDGILAHLRRYAGPTLKAKLAQRESIADHRYDWGLNGTDPDPQR